MAWRHLFSDLELAQLPHGDLMAKARSLRLSETEVGEVSRARRRLKNRIYSRRARARRRWLALCLTAQMLWLGEEETAVRAEIARLLRSWRRLRHDAA